MKNFVHKTILIFLVMFFVLPTLPIKSEVKVNLVDSNTTITGSESATFEGGVFKQTNSKGEYLALLNIPNLINQYSWSGDVKILEYGTTSAASGVRFCIGNDEVNNNFFNLILTRSAGISAERRGSVYESDVYPISKDTFNRVLDPGAEFHFEIRKQGNFVMMLIDGNVVMDTSFPGKYDFFTPGSEKNIGFYSANCSFEVKNIKVYNEPELIFNSKNTLTFNDLETGTLAKGRYDNWFIEWPSTNSSAVELNGDSKSLKVDGYFQGVFAYRPSEKYSANFNFRGTSYSQNLGFFIRSSRERYLSNNANAPHAEYFEADSAGSIGGSGIFLNPLTSENKIQINIKQYDTNATKKIRSRSATIDVKSIMGEKTQLTHMTNLRFEDEGSIIKAYVNNTLIATIELSEDTIKYSELMQITNKASTDTFVKTATLKDAEGNVLLTVENTLVTADYSIIGIGARAVKTTYIDDLNVEIDLVKLESALLPYSGAQIRTNLVPYKDKDGNINTSDLRQGLRFCFDLQNIKESVLIDGEEYTVTGQGALLILEDSLAGYDYDDIIVENVGVISKLVKQEELTDYVENDKTYKSAYIYNIPKEHKDTVIVCRAYVKCENGEGDVKYIYSEILKKSITDVYNSIIAAGDEHLISDEVKNWLSGGED